MPSLPSKKIETFLNPHKNRPYEIEFECAEFTCVCPKTGQPDFATLYLRYIPKNLCIELKSLKLYLWSYRNEGLFHEAATNQILDDLVRACDPRFMEIEASFNIRGGIKTTVRADYGSEDEDGLY